MNITIRNLIFGSGLPKICVPITGATAAELFSEIEAVRKTAADLIEWRADYFKTADSLESVKSTAKALRVAAGEMPLIFTYRTKGEGGEREILPEVYTAIIKAAVETGCFDIIDCELNAGDGVCCETVEMSHKNGIKVIVSNHDFDKTPTKDEIVRRLRKMRDLGADIPKIAVMPQSAADVLALMSASVTAAQDMDCPIITVSMGRLGVLSRVSGSRFGSCVTFGMAEKASAPGQLDADDLKMIMEKFREC